MLILNEESSVGSKQYANELEITGQSEEDFDYSDEAEVAETENHKYNNEAALQEAEDEGQVLDKQADDDEGTESDEDKQEEAFSGQFKDEDYEGVIFVQNVILCNMQHKAGIPDNWILLDSQLTVDVFCNDRMLTNICDVKQNLTLHCNAGTTSISKKGDLKGYGTVWYQPDGIANILSLNNVKKKYKVTYDSKLDDSFIVHKGNGSQHVLKLSKKRIYYSDMTNDIGTTLVSMVDIIKNKYSVRQYSNARKAHLLQSTIGRPSTEDFIRYVEGNMIPNCNVTRDDIICAEDIFGPNLGSLKGKMTRRPTEHVHTLWTSIPQEIIQQYGEVTLAVDIMAINEIPFLITTSRNIHLCTAELICNKTKKP